MILAIPDYIAYYAKIKTKPIIIHLYDRNIQELLKEMNELYKEELL